MVLNYPILGLDSNRIVWLRVTLTDSSVLTLFLYIPQVEMCLLGQALETTIRVCRPRNVEQEDFLTHYPDHMIEQWDCVNLIAEDDRHYNIAVM